MALNFNVALTPVSFDGRGVLARSGTTTTTTTSGDGGTTTTTGTTGGADSTTTGGADTGASTTTCVGWTMHAAGHVFGAVLPLGRRCSSDAAAAAVVTASASR